MREVKKTKTAKLIVILCAVAIAFAGCTVFNDSSTETSGKRQNGTAYESKTAEGPVDQQPGTNEVQILIENFAFVPSEITIVPGTKITWINKDEAPHTATSTDKKFNTGGLDTDDKYSFVFNDKGEFPYFCALHPHMTASITVK
jgi:plastocyanin